MKSIAAEIRSKSNQKLLDMSAPSTANINQLANPEISLLGEMRTDSLTKQYNACGNPTCRCKDGKRPRKPYYQLSFTRHGKSTSEFVEKKMSC
jgi:hypothetical protein